MRQLTFLLICLSFTMNVFANNNAQLVYNDAKEYYYRGLTKKGDAAIVFFEKAQEGFKICKKSLSKQFDRDDLERWISKCEDAIRLKRQQEIDELEAATAAEIEATKRKIAELKAAERRAAEERLAKEEERIRQKQAEELEAKRQKRIEDKLVFVSSDAFIFDRKYDLHSSVERALSDDGFRLTDDPEKARWSVYITAMAYEVGTEYITTSHGEEQIYLSNVDALVKIADNVKDDLIFEGNIEYNHKDIGINYQKSAQEVFTQLKKDISSTISNKFKNINQ